MALKNDNVIVQMHLMSGNRQLIAPSMPQMASDGTMQPLRISQRMRLEPIQVEGVAKRMQVSHFIHSLVSRLHKTSLFVFLN